MIHITCTDNPFRLFHEEDISNIMIFLGRVEDRLRHILSDTRDKIVKPLSEWILKGCDVNNDVDVGGILHLTMPAFQLRLCEKALRGGLSRWWKARHIIGWRSL